MRGREPSARRLAREHARDLDCVIALLPLALAIERGESVTEERVVRELGAVKFGQLLPKTPIPGSLHLEYKRCGRSNCRCASGKQFHGGYWYHYWRDNGRQRKEYVPMRELARVRAGIARWRQLNPPARSMRDTLAELRGLSQEAVPT